MVYCLLVGLPLCAQKHSIPPEEPDSLLRLYRNDADRLCLRATMREKTMYKDSVHLDDRRGRFYYKALEAVYRAKHLPARDTVVKFLDIHTYNPGMNAIVLRGRSNLVWMDNLRNNRFPTENAQLDEVIRSYGLRKTFYSTLFQPNLVVLSSKANYNLEALATLLEKVHGLSGIQPEFLHGDGNDIYDSVVGKNLELTYTYGWGHCRNGCQNRRYWKFSINEQLQVQYMGSWGERLEPALEIRLLNAEGALERLPVYPNPAKDLIYIDGNVLPGAELYLRIHNRKGELVFSRTAIRGNEVIDIRHLLMGSYTMSIELGTVKNLYELQKNFYPQAAD